MPTRMTPQLTRMARVARMARMLTRMTRWLAGSHIIHTREWRCRSDLGGVTGDKTSGRTSKARNEAVAIAG